MSRFFKKKTNRVFTLIIAALLFGAIIASVAHWGDTPVSKAVVTVMKPFQQVSTFFGNYLDGFCNHFRSSDTLQKENAQLKQDIADYQGKLADYENTKRTLKTYEEFLEVKQEHEDYQFSAASVLARDVNDAYGSVILNKGSSDGIEVNDPVIFGKNLVGVVSDVSLASCTVTTIASPDFNASVYETRSDETGYVTGFEDGGKKNTCKLPGLTKESTVAAGGIVCTLGIGGVFPKDLIVGTVTEINKSKTDISFYASVKSNIDISEIKDVFIITDFDGQGIAE